MTWSSCYLILLLTMTRSSCYLILLLTMTRTSCYLTLLLTITRSNTYWFCCDQLTRSSYWLSCCRLSYQLVIVVDQLPNMLIYRSANQINVSFSLQLNTWYVYLTAFICFVNMKITIFFFRCTALELAPKKIRVNSVNPGIEFVDLVRWSRNIALLEV